MHTALLCGHVHSKVRLHSIVKLCGVNALLHETNCENNKVSGKKNHGNSTVCNNEQDKK